MLISYIFFMYITQCHYNKIYLLTVPEEVDVLHWMLNFVYNIASGHEQ